MSSTWAQNPYEFGPKKICERSVRVTPARVNGRSYKKIGERSVRVTPARVNGRSYKKIGERSVRVTPARVNGRKRKKLRIAKMATDLRMAIVSIVIITVAVAHARM